MYTYAAAAAAAKSLQSCPTLCNPMDCSLLGSSVHGILQARILEWVTMPFLLHGILWVQGLNLHLLRLLHGQVGSLPLAPPAQTINNVVIVSGEQRRDPAIHIHVSILLQPILPPRLPHNIEQSSLCYTVGPFWLSILNIALCPCPSQMPPILSLATINLFSKSVSLFLFCK